MLITNFASGELSETLFGRIDLGQYYQGVSYLENFDVIPTGGISRRNGTKRLAALEGEGRIIPFLMDRENHFLFFLSPGKISVYKEGVKLGQVNSGFSTIKDIQEAQYAQNYDTMIMVHENHEIIEVKLETSPSLTQLVFYQFQIQTAIEVKVTGDLNPAHFPETDPAYASWLKTPGNYPGSVVFFQGRLVFANTKNNRQRIFCSRAGNIHDFSTYKKFLTEVREYTTAHGKLETGSNRVILDENYSGMQFKGKINEYIVDSPYFPEGTMVTEIQGNLLFLSNATSFDNSLTQAEEEALEAYTENYEQIGEQEATWQLAYYANEQGGFNAPTVEWRHAARITVKGETAKYHEMMQFKDPDGDVGNWVPTWEEEDRLSKEEIMLTELESDYLLNRIKDKLIGFSFPAPTWDNAAIQAAAAMWRDNVLTMGFTFRGEKLYGKPEDVKAQIENIRERMGTVFIPLYKKNILEDRYPTAEDGFTFEIASDMSDAIRWLGQNKHLLVGTETAEWIIPAGTTALNVQAVLNSRYGSARIQGTTIGDAMCFIQAGAKAVVEYYIPQTGDNNFRANNLALLSKNMLHEYPAKYIDFVSSPYTKIFICREDGILVNLLYERGTGTFAWGRITTTGSIISVATLPGETGYDELYLVVERGGDFFLERLDERSHVYLDGAEPYQGDNEGYGEDAVIFDENTLTVYPRNEAPAPAFGMWIGFPFTSVARSMPVLANQKMKQNIIKTLLIRFHDSFMPKMKSLPNNVQNTIPWKEPFSGVVQVNFPGSFDRDVFFEFSHSKPTRCRILSINAEAN